MPEAHVLVPLVVHQSPVCSVAVLSAYGYLVQEAVTLSMMILKFPPLGQCGPN